MSTSGLGRPGSLVLIACLASVGGAAPLPGQEPDSARVQDDTTAVRDSTLVADSALLVRPRAERCVLQWEPLAPDTEGLSLREGGEAHVTHVSGRMLWTCGTAQMEADSAVKNDRARRVDLIGNVVYRDTTRTLQSRFLTYFELQDLVIATGDVELERIGDGSTLEGPRVEFLRAVSGIDELTIATGRPHMRLYPEGDDRTNPFEIDADRTVFAGEEEARAYGDVIIAREDLNAAADSAYLRRIDETGVLWGSPWVDSEGVRLSGDTIRFASEDDELRDVHAVGDGHAIGESFEVRSEKIDVELLDREVEAVWAHGEGGSEAVSGAHHVYGDSLRFVMFAGGIDTLFAVGQAAAVQADGPVAVARLDAPEETDEGAVADSAVEAPVAADTVAAPADSAAGPPGRAGVDLDTAVVAPDPEVAPADSAEAPPDSAAEGPPAAGTGSIRPRLGVDGRGNWVRGDTLIAIFERDSAAVRATRDPAAFPVADSIPSTGAPVGGLPDTDSLAVIDAAGAPPAPAVADTTSDPSMERLIVIGNASSFYRQVRDTARTSRPSRNYMIGKRIDVLFEGGEPKTVKGTEAIGIYLEPEEGVAGEGPGAPADTGLAAPDSVVVRDSSLVLPDSLARDSAAAPADSAAAPADSAVAPPDSTLTRRDLADAPLRPTPRGSGAFAEPRRTAVDPLETRLRRRRS